MFQSLFFAVKQLDKQKPDEPMEVDNAKSSESAKKIRMTTLETSSQDSRPPGMHTSPQMHHPKCQRMYSIRPMRIAALLWW